MSIRTVFLGPPGCGKGSQAVFVVDRHSVSHISTGELLREAVKAQTQLGQQVADIMAQGSLVPDRLVIDLIDEYLDQIDLAKGFVLDGFPRSLNQAKELDVLLDNKDKRLTFVLHLHVEREILIKRLTGRRTCKTCGKIYNIYFSAPEVEDHCDDQNCNGQLMHRTDDNVDSISNRLSVYDAETKPLLDYYEKSGLLRTINASRSLSDIADDVESLISAEVS